MKKPGKGKKKRNRIQLSWHGRHCCDCTGSAWKTYGAEQDFTATSGLYDSKAAALEKSIEVRRTYQGNRSRERIYEDR